MSLWSAFANLFSAPPREQPEQLVLGLENGNAYVTSAETLLHHIFVEGATGSGKSVYATNLFYQIAALPSNWSIIVIDVKDGELCRDIIQIIPEQRLADCLYIDVADTGWPVSLNFLSGIPEERQSLAASEFLSCFRRLFDMSTAPRAEYILLMATLLLLQIKGATMLDLLRLLRDPDYRHWAAQQAHGNAAVMSFWTSGEYEDIVGKNSTSNVQSIINKIGGLLALPEVARLLGQGEHKLDIRQCMDTGKILLFNYPKGIIGEVASAVLAATTVTQCQLAAQSRADTPLEQRHKTVLIADEVQNFAVSSLNTLLSEGRTERVGVVACCQFEKQLPPLLHQTIQANCAYRASCQRRENRASHRASHHVVLTPLQEPERDLLAVDALALPPLPSPRRNPANQRAVRDRSRQLLARPRADIDRELAARLNSIPGTDQEERSDEPFRFYDEH